MSGPFGTVLGFLHRLTGPTAGEGESDGQLLARFVAGRDEAAFTGLLHRHGPMVLGLCRRALGNVQAAEDAFQATFLVLAKKAASIRRREAVGSWLYGVAYRIAARIREQDVRRRTAEARAVRPPEGGPDLDSAWRELQTVLDDALHRLPEKYRVPVLLCYLEGLTHEEAAARIGCPVGTVRSRLARGRQRLRDGLARRGLTMSATAFAAALATLPTTAVASPLHNTTLQAALLFSAGRTAAVDAPVLALAQGALRTMLLTRVVTAIALVLAVGLAAAALHALPSDPAPPASPPREERPAPVPVARERTTLRGHEQMVWAVAFSPDGKTLATAAGLYNRPGELVLWDRATGRQRAWVQEEKGLRALAFSPDGKTLATADYYANVVKLRDADTGKARMTLETGAANNAVAFSPDGKTLAVAVLRNSAQLWDVATGRKLHELADHTDWVPHVAFSPDGTTLASGCRDGVVKLWDVASGKERLKLEGHGGIVEFVAFSPDGRTLATASWDKTVRLWEVATGKERAALKGHEYQVLSVAFAPDGRTLASTSGGAQSPITEKGDKAGEVKLWDVASQKELASLPGHQLRIWMARFAPDGKALATAAEDQTIKLWDLAPRPAPAARDATPKELGTWWADLATGDAGRAFRSVCDLAAARPAVAFLAGRLEPAAPPDPALQERLAWLVADLDSDTFARREQATAELTKLGKGAEPALRKVLDGKPSAELRRRAEELLGRLRGPISDPDTLRTVRAVEVLEWTGTAEARRLLETLSKGEPSARLTREAKAALSRLARSP